MASSDMLVTQEHLEVFAYVSINSVNEYTAAFKNVIILFFKQTNYLQLFYLQGMERDCCIGKCCQ